MSSVYSYQNPAESGRFHTRRLGEFTFETTEFTERRAGPLHLRYRPHPLLSTHRDAYRYLRAKSRLATEIQLPGVKLGSCTSEIAPYLGYIRIQRLEQGQTNPSNAQQYLVSFHCSPSSAVALIL